MVGQKLLYHAATQLPHLLALPDKVPQQVVLALYVLPMAEAVKLVGGRGRAGQGLGLKLEVGLGLGGRMSG